VIAQLAKPVWAGKGGGARIKKEPNRVRMKRREGSAER